MTFAASVLYSGLCTASIDFRAVKHLCRGGILVPLPRDVLSLTQAIGFIEVVYGCNFNILHAYLAFRSTGNVVWESDGNDGWFLYSALTALFQTFRLEKSRGVSVL